MRTTERITVRTNVTFPRAGLNLAGHLYIPESDAWRPRAAIVVGPSSSGVKEQASGLYARRLAEQGFVALAFDPAYQGESEGEPRGLEDPTHRTEDFKAAVSYLTTRHDVVDPERIGSLGICGSVFPSTAEEAFTRGGEYGREGFEYYRTPRGEHPRSAKHLPWISVDPMTFFDAFQGADLIAPRPVLLIVGSRAVTSWMSVDAYQRAQEPKELYWIEGASHVDLYDKDEYVPPAVDKLAEFYKANLAAAADKLALAG